MGKKNSENASPMMPNFPNIAHQKNYWLWGKKSMVKQVNTSVTFCFISFDNKQKTKNKYKTE